MSTSSSEDHRRIMNFPARKKLQGPRPAALKVSRFSSEVKKSVTGASRRRSPVVIYLVSPKVIHVRPEEFMGLVQRLTGKQAPSPGLPPSPCKEMEKNDKSVISGVNNDVVDDHYASSPAPSGDSAAYSSFCIDFYPEWDEF